MELVAVVFPLAVFIIYMLVGVIVIVVLDHEERWLCWFEACPSLLIQMAILTLWPVTVIVMLATWRRWR